MYFVMMDDEKCVWVVMLEGGEGEGEGEGFESLCF